MNKEYRMYYEADCHRGGTTGYTHMMLKLFRKAQFSDSIVDKKVSKFFYKLLSYKNGVEIPISCKIGKGFSIYHPFNITINPETVIGENCDIHKGVLIGTENRGKRKGSPIIGNCVWIGPNAVITGKISIGDDVLIAANSFVNCDIPSHSIVYGNPAVVKQVENATKDYINRIV